MCRSTDDRAGSISERALVQTLPRGLVVQNVEIVLVLRVEVDTLDVGQVVGGLSLDRGLGPAHEATLVRVVVGYGRGALVHSLGLPLLGRVVRVFVHGLGHGRRRGVPSPKHQATV